MKTKLTVVAFLLLVSTLLYVKAGFTQNQYQNTAGTEQTIRKLNRDYVDSFLRSDVKRYDELLADDFICTCPDGSLVDKPAFLKSAAEPSEMEYFGLEDVKIRIFGDVVLVHARTPYKRKDGVTGESRYTDIYARRNGRWQVVSAQITRVIAPVTHL
jgi:ketosteroid isomerase-like protein